MSMDSDASSQGGDHRSFRQITRDLVEDLYKRRQPLPSLDAIYFIQPTKDNDSVLKHASSDFRKLGQRIFVFVIGGASRSELRAAHKLTSKLKREIILGSSSLDDPRQFITKLKMMSAEELTLDDLQI